MNRAWFVIWMLLYPIILSLAEAIMIVARWRAGIPAKVYEDSTHAIASIIETIIWLYIGYILWRDNHV